jgi:arsenate reductase-like glutaredoxin family protein
MIKLYTIKNCPGCADVIDMMLEMNIAHEVINIDIDTFLDPGISDNYDW